MTAIPYKRTVKENRIGTESAPLPMFGSQENGPPQGETSNEELPSDDLQPRRLLEEQTNKRVAMARKGCMESFRQLVLDHHRIVRLFLARHIRCDSQVDDLAQEVFLTAYLQLAHFRNESSFSTWLLSVARNKAMTFVRNEMRHRSRREEYFEAELASKRLVRLCDSRSTAEQTHLRIDALRSCLDQLEPSSLMLIDQFYFCQESAAKIAADTNKKPGSVRMKLLRIRSRLVDCISRKTESEI